MHPRRARRVRSLIQGALALLSSGCGGLVVADVPTVADADDQVATCKVARDPLNPLIVEWPGTSKVDLESSSKRGLVIVSYAGCTLKVLSNCRADGAYGFMGVTPARDTLTVSTMTDLYARLPLGAASLKGELSSGTSLDLQYIAVGIRRAETAPVTMTGDCGGASHYVDRMTLGAYALDAVASGSAGAGVDVMGAGIGGERKESRKKLRGSGEIKQCDGKTPNQESELRDSGCGAILQIGLAPLRGSAAPITDPVLASPPKVARASGPGGPGPAEANPKLARLRQLKGDRDADGLGDHIDKCPDEPEDKDGFQDEDGCPDPDNDEDGWLDREDKCPNVSGPPDNEGCPIGDRDSDGWDDQQDDCPDIPENRNGVSDDDGCPD